MRSIIESILSTDITFHHKYFAHIKNKLQTLRQNLYKMLFSDNVQKIFNNQQSLLNWSIHAADISGSSKPFKIWEKCKVRIFEEFFLERDKEKEVGLPISLLCDREVTDANKSQIGLINFISIPSFEAHFNIIPEVCANLDNLNLKTYMSMLKEEESTKY